MDQNFIDKWISIDEAAEYLGIKTVTLRGWIKKMIHFQHIKLENNGNLSVQK
nr:hypothetical protein [Peptostreptococcus stomatis]